MKKRNMNKKFDVTQQFLENATHAEPVKFWRTYGEEKCCIYPSTSFNNIGKVEIYSNETRYPVYEELSDFVSKNNLSDFQGRNIEGDPLFKSDFDELSWWCAMFNTSFSDENGRSLTKLFEKSAEMNLGFSNTGDIRDYVHMQRQKLLSQCEEPDAQLFAEIDELTEGIEPKDYLG